ncbi:MAG: hypothetical protein JO307_27830 [Bryobacterales bacterium]|nr:hypothetical protein [Bryobacterales bacterium]MBV9400239.1 hypothetical protein [Bryobacterales bacterium]
MRRHLIIVAAVIFGAALRADFSYQEITRSGKRVLRSTAKSIKGNRMVERAKDRATIVNLDAETLTELDFTKKTYVVIPFAGRKQETPAVSFQVLMQDGGFRKIGVLQAKETVLTMTAENNLKVTVEAWFSSIPGYDEVRTFQRKLGEKLGYGLSVEAPPWAIPGLGAAIQEMNKIDAVPIQRTLRIISGTNEFETVVELDELGSAPADPAKFEVPPGFKKIESGASAPQQTPPPTPAAPK